MRCTPLEWRVSGSWEEVALSEVEKSFKRRREVYEEIEYWVKTKKWRVRGQGHKYGLYPPDPGFRVMPPPPPWVRVDGTSKSDSKWQAKTTRRECQKLERAIKEQSDSM